MADLAKNIKDTGYVAIGLGVIGFQRAQVLRHDLRKQVDAQLGDTKAQVAKGRHAVETRLQQVEARVQKAQSLVAPVVDRVEDALPGQAKDIVGRAREQLNGLLARSA